jgi:hypothetical protein
MRQDRARIITSALWPLAQPWKAAFALPTCRSPLAKVLVVYLEPCPGMSHCYSGGVTGRGLTLHCCRSLPVDCNSLPTSKAASGFHTYAPEQPSCAQHWPQGPCDEYLVECTAEPQHDAYEYADNSTWADNNGRNYWRFLF